MICVVPTPSLEGNKYFLTFVDDFSRKIWVYLIKEKGKVFSIFEKFCALLKDRLTIG